MMIFPLPTRRPLSAVALAGSDGLSGMAGNDRTGGGLGDDTYGFNEASWGADTIVDTQERVDFATGKFGNALNFGARANDGTITVNLTPGAGPEVKKGTSTVNWSGPAISTVVISGANGGHSITGNDAPNLIQVLAGGSTISSGGGDDRIIAVRQGTAADTIDCGDGIDTVFFDEGTDQVAANCENRNPPQLP